MSGKVLKKSKKLLLVEVVFLAEEVQDTHNQMLFSWTTYCKNEKETIKAVQLETVPADFG